MIALSLKLFQLSLPLLHNKLPQNLVAEITIFLYLTMCGSEIPSGLSWTVWLRVVRTEVTPKDMQQVAGLEQVQEGFSACLCLSGGRWRLASQGPASLFLGRVSLWLSIWVVWFLAWPLRAPGNRGRSCWSCGGRTIASLSPYSVGQSSHKPEQNQEGKWPPLLGATFNPQGALSSVAVYRNLCIFKGCLSCGFGLTWLKQCPLSSEGAPRRVNKVNFCVRGPWGRAAQTALACASQGDLVKMQTLTQQVCSEA